jgi:hypothetical protein
MRAKRRKGKYCRRQPHRQDGAQVFNHPIARSPNHPIPQALSSKLVRQY